MKGFLWITSMLAFGLAALPSQLAACDKADAPAPLYDRSWVQSDVPLVGVGSLGAFRTRLGSNDIQPIGDHAGTSVSDFQMSPNRQMLLYGLTDRQHSQTYWLYDITSGHEQKLDVLTDKVGRLVFAPDGRRLAWFRRDGVAASVIGVNGEILSDFRLPDEAGTITSAISHAWTRTGTNILLGIRTSAGDKYWSIDPATSLAKQVDARVERRPVPIVRYFDDGQEIGVGCSLCGRREAAQQLDLANGARVVSSDGVISVHWPDGRTKSIAVWKEKPVEVEVAPGVVESVASACGSGPPALFDAIDGRYVIYFSDWQYWVYGVEEDRAAAFPKYSTIEW